MDSDKMHDKLFAYLSYIFFIKKNNAIVSTNNYSITIIVN